MTDDPLWAAIAAAHRRLSPERISGLPDKSPWAFRQDAIEAAWCDWEERAAILEFDGGWSRQDAETLAISERGGAPPVSVKANRAP